MGFLSFPPMARFFFLASAVSPLFLPSLSASPKAACRSNRKMLLEKSNLKKFSHVAKFDPFFIGKQGVGVQQPRSKHLLAWMVTSLS